METVKVLVLGDTLLESLGRQLANLPKTLKEKPIEWTFLAVCPLQPNDLLLQLAERERSPTIVVASLAYRRIAREVADQDRPLLVRRLCKALKSAFHESIPIVWVAAPPPTWGY